MRPCPVDSPLASRCVPGFTCTRVGLCIDVPANVSTPVRRPRCAGAGHHDDDEDGVRPREDAAATRLGVAISCPMGRPITSRLGGAFAPFHLLTPCSAVPAKDGAFSALQCDQPVRGGGR